MEAVRWLERLERGDISTVVRRDLNVELAPVEIKKRMAKFGNFQNLTKSIMKIPKLLITECLRTRPNGKNITDSTEKHV